ncbi:MAG: helix-turn-helix domain-containing protein [Streptococcaceae bacterium]|jgi:predicted DNA-binding transcriptional regulator AlpA|nr:helix-turn-helix domain-containing protein [Streptococcaceae bacterium]
METLKIILTNEQLTIICNQICKIFTNDLQFTHFNDNQKRYMNKKQACSYLSICNNTLDTWIHKGLPVIKINGSIRFDKLSIDKWLTKQII